jgi:hypothetical protein
MPRYFPIEMNIEIKASASDMVALYSRHGAVVADFAIPHDTFSYLRVRFDHANIIRTLDEMPLSTEEHYDTNEGLVRDHLAYRVEDSLFWKTQSESFKFTHADVRHYRFITGWTCLDVIAGGPPLITIVPADVGPGHISNSHTAG